MPSKEWLEKHIHVDAFLPREYSLRLNKVLGEYGYSFTRWLKAMIDRCYSDRLPEGQGVKIRREFDRDFVEDVAESMIWYASMNRTLAEMVATKDEDPLRRAEHRRIADRIDSRAAEALEWLDDFNKQDNVLESGLKKKRHRYKDQSRSA